MKKLFVSALLLSFSSLALADVIVIDFDDNSGGQFNTPQFEDGFVIDPALAPFDPVIAPIEGGNGTNSLFFCGWCADDATEGVSIYSQVGLTFELDSLDVFSNTTFATEDFQGAGTVTGYLQGGGTITKGISATLGIETVFFDDAWQNLTSLDIEFEVSSFNTYGVSPVLDNITLQAVPIPAAAWLFGSALAGLGWMRRK